ncbi:MAG: 4-alpha-glucanotransferase [Rheinheimera sp.]|nr:4-alpha-glucanotransferase [Rheinheimera sp.]
MRQLALYDALHLHLLATDPHAWGWPNWPEAISQHQISEAVLAFAVEHQDDIEFFSYLQFCAQQQLAQSPSCMPKHNGMLLGLYRDFGGRCQRSVRTGEIRANPDLYCRNASVGAPPDILGTQKAKIGVCRRCCLMSYSARLTSR